MRTLLDTNALLWLFIDDEKLPKRFRDLIYNNDNELYFSQVSLWEITIKFSLGKLKLRGINPNEFYDEVRRSGINCLFLTNDIITTSYKLNSCINKDPFDRILAWQAIQNDMYFLSSDGKLEDFKEFGLKIA